MAIALFAMFILPDLPHNTRGFTEEERAMAVYRMAEDVGEADEDSKEESVFAGFFMAVKDLKIYVLMITFTAYVVGLSFNAFFPTLTKTLGFPYITTLLMSAPPWAFACIVSLINAWHADRTQERFWHIVGPIIVGMIGFVISMSTLNVAGRYLALFLQGAYPYYSPPPLLRAVLIPNSGIVCRLHMFLFLDILVVPSSPSEARCCHCHGERFFAVSDPQPFCTTTN